MSGAGKLAAIIVVVTAALASARQESRDGITASASGSATISGTIAAGDQDARPVRRALVTLSGAAIGIDRITLTDDGGRFSFSQLPAGRFTIAAKKAAWVTSYFGGTRPGHGPGTPVALADGQRLSIRMTMLPGAVIAGVVRDHLGQACAGEVRLLESRTLNGAATLASVVSSSATAHDGYRFFGLAPGTYFIVARNTVPADMNGHRAQSAAEIDAALRDLAAGRQPGVSAGAPLPGTIALGSPIGYTPTFHPSAADPALATPIVVSAGEERGGVDVMLQLVPAATLAGIVVDASGKVPRGLQLAIISPSAATGFSGYNVSTAVSTRNGSFSRDGQTPGHYSLFARAEDPAGLADSSTQATGATSTGTPTALALWGAAELDLDGHDVPNLVITLRRGVTVSGRLSFDTSTAPMPRDLHVVQLRLTPIATRGFNLGVPPISARADGTFAFAGVPPGRYLISVGVPGAATLWTTESARLAEVDTLDTLLTVPADKDITDVVVTMTDHPSVLSGMLLDQLKRPAPEYTVVVFATDRLFWMTGSRRVVQQRPAHDGRFLVAGLPAGEYFVGAVTSLEGVDLTDAAFLDTLAAASARITLAKGETRTLDLQIASAGKIWHLAPQ